MFIILGTQRDQLRKSSSLTEHPEIGNRKLYMFYFKNQFLILVINIPPTRRVKGHITVHCSRREIGNR